MKVKEKKQKKQKRKIPYYRKPDDMTVDEWQIALRRQFAEKQDFKVTNLGDNPVFSDFLVYNPVSQSENKVAIRSYEFGENFCSCLDFKKNQLGTCKHIEFVLKQLKDNPKYKKYWQQGYIRPYSSISLKYGKERKVFLRIGTENSEAVKELAKKYFDRDNFLLPHKYFEITDFLEEVRKLDPDFRIYDDALAFIIDERSRIIRHNIIDTKFSDGIESEAFNGLINARLYPYQKEGVLKAAKAGRVIIADDMGLGKTIQAIAVAEIYAKYFHINHVLIISPTSLKYQWKNEIEKFTERKVKVIEGPLNKRKFQYTSDEFYKIASYGVALNDLDYLNDADFDLIILDEAQRIKNWQTKTARNLKKLYTPYAIVLTGTPLENKLEELYSIVEFINPFRLGALFRFLDYHQIKDAEGMVQGYHRLNQIRKHLDDILIRRTKSEILKQLPERIDKNLLIDMTKEQREIHQDHYYTASRLVNKWRKYGFLSEQDRQRLMIAMNCMRMVADSTFILDQKTRYDRKIDELVIILKEIFESSNDKVVIFSQWERMTRLVAQELENMGIKFEYLHGGVPSPKRKDLINNFNNNPDIRVFLSTDAGGVGLNLQAGNVVINIDLPWNPAVLEQRIARVHRLGQQKNVRVINFVSRLSMEHRILFILQYKKSIFEGVLDGGEDRVIMNESNFSKLMKTIEILEDIDIEDVSETDTKKALNSVPQLAEPEKEKDKKKISALPRAGEKKKPQKKTKTSTGETIDSGAANELADLFTAGASFFEKIGSAFAKMQTGEIKVTDFVEKDAKTGKTSIKIPVQNEDVITDTINNLAKAFAGFLSKK